MEITNSPLLVLIKVYFISKLSDFSPFYLVFVRLLFCFFFYFHLFSLFDLEMSNVHRIKAASVKSTMRFLMESPIYICTCLLTINTQIYCRNTWEFFRPFSFRSICLRELEFFRIFYSRFRKSRESYMLYWPACATALVFFSSYPWLEKTIWVNCKIRVIEKIKTDS